MSPSEIDLVKQNEVFEQSSPQEILSWAYEQFASEVALLSSFGPESIVLLHLVSQVTPEMKVHFLETGYHFQETLDYKKQVTEKLKLNVEDLKSKMPREEFVAQHGDDLYAKDPDLCCEINKVEPLKRALGKLRAWVSGIRRSQGPTRQDTKILELYDQGLYKLNPLATWNSKDIWQYIKEHSLPVHSLYDQGYTSVGCHPCTRPVLSGEGADERAGRWAGRVKTECGIHTFMKPKQSDPS